MITMKPMILCILLVVMLMLLMTLAQVTHRTDAAQPYKTQEPPPINAITATPGATKTFSLTIEPVHTIVVSPTPTNPCNTNG